MKGFEVSKLIIFPECYFDMKRYIKLNKEYKDLGPIVKYLYHEYKNVLSNIDSAKQLLSKEKDLKR